MRSGPFLFTKIGAGLSAMVVVAWIATFEPHGGVELSNVLVPLWHLASEDIFRDRAVPVLIWYAGVLLHWPVVGLVVDLFRAFGRGVTRVDSPRNKA